MPHLAGPARAARAKRRRALRYSLAAPYPALLPALDGGGSVRKELR